MDVDSDQSAAAVNIKYDPVQRTCEMVQLPQSFWCSAPGCLWVLQNCGVRCAGSVHVTLSAPTLEAKITCRQTIASIQKQSVWESECTLIYLKKPQNSGMCFLSKRLKDPGRLHWIFLCLLLSGQQPIKQRNACGTGMKYNLRYFFLIIWTKVKSRS